MCFVSSSLSYFIQMTCALGLVYYEMYPVDERIVNDFLIGKQKWIIHVIRCAYFMICNVVEAIITLN